MSGCHPTRDARFINILEKLISDINRLINAQVNHILHHTRFQQLEASWRGITLLSTHADKHKGVKLKLLNLCAKALYKDIGNATDPEHTALFHKLYTQEFDTPGGEPYGILLGDYHFSHHPQPDIKDSISVLNTLGQICTAAFCPFVGGISPTHFGVDQFADMPQHIEMGDLFKQTQYTRWKSLKSNEATRFINLALPEFMIRKPYTTQTPRLHSRFFTETIQQATDLLFANAVYLVGCSVIECFIETGWFGKLRGHQLKLRETAVPNFGRLAHATDAPNTHLKSLTALAVTDNFERKLSNLGYLSLKDTPWQNAINIYNCPSLYTAHTQHSKIGTTNTKISSMLHYVLCVSRFAHYVKIIARDKIGAFVDAKSCEAALNRWLHQYTTASKTSAANILAQYPLSAANVQIKPKPGLAGEFNGIIHIKPHYQLDSMSSHLKLVTDIKLN